MSLNEVMLEIAEEMIKEADDLKSQNEFFWMTLRNYAKQIKVAVRACEGQSVIALSDDRSHVFLHPDAQHFQMIERARRELRDQKRAAEGLESMEPRFIVCKGGPADGDTVSIPPDMPVGAHTMIDGGVYTNQGLTLDFDEVATKARRGEAK